MSWPIELQEQINLVFYGLPIYQAFARSEKACLDLIAKCHNVDEAGHLRFLVTGSLSERFPDSVQSDVDHLVILNSHEIITADWQAKAFYPVEQAPEFLNIYVPETDVLTFQNDFRDVSHFYGLLHSPDEKRAFISAEEARNLNQNDFLPEFLKHNKPSAPWESPANKKNSPAYCLQSQDVETLTADRVPALQCEGWPEIAGEWIKRKPRHWPNSSLVEKISSRGFCVVPKPSGISEDHEAEWRFAFNFAEAELLQNFDENHVKVYYVLRSLYLKHLEERLGGVVRSYHIKTLMLWMLEENEPSFWSNHSVVAILHKFFVQLHEVLEKGFCPHYFISKHNLFYNTLEEPLKKAASEIALLLKDPAPAFHDITEKGYLGLLPRFGVWTVESLNKFSGRVLELPEYEAYKVLTSKSDSNLKYCKLVKQECFLEVLKDCVCAMKMDPLSECFVQINFSFIFHGYHFALATKESGSELRFNKAIMTQPDPEFFEIDVDQMNRSVLVWLELCKMSLERVLQGRKSQLIRFVSKVVSFVELDDDILLPELKHFRKMCSIAAGFLASTKLNTEEIDFPQLLQVLNESFPSTDEEFSQDASVIETAIFVLAGGTFRMTKEILNSKAIHSTPT